MGFRRHWCIDNVQLATIALLSGSLILILIPTAPYQEIDAEDQIDVKTDWTAVLNKKTRVPISKVERLEWTDTIVYTAEETQRPRLIGVNEYVDVTAIGKSDQGSIEINCGRTKFVRRVNQSPSNYRRCIHRNQGVWHKGACTVIYYLDLITIEAENKDCAYTWRKLPARKGKRAEKILHRRPRIEVREFDRVVDERRFEWSWPLVQLLIASLLTMAGLVVLLGQIVYRPKKRVSEKAKPLIQAFSI